MFQSVVRGSRRASAHVSAGHEKLSEAEGEGREAEADGLLEGVWDADSVLEAEAEAERVPEGLADRDRETVAVSETVPVVVTE